ncbi:hypothetical protein WA1_18690 [Scytonema hofmannii PCC 7110]|uniref:SWIM-type domain-containing protein n=1 Tax=Scytonema hofmannii PCC 7110 TaxID=128403 RepID=A0A139XBN7_9CYAN|nr:hypothetical protein [Scytonema hofmannii]KYC42032.1 hypothetical protein WA1_18690 [Scytonema hofmannii PCC 7110]
MTHPVYSRDYLAKQKRPKLWAICSQLGLPKYPTNDDCVTEILAFQQDRIIPVAVAEIVADNLVNTTSTTAAGVASTTQQLSTCATCPYFESFGEASGRGGCKLLSHLVVRTHHPRTSDCDRLAEAFEQAQSEQVSEIAPEIVQTPVAQVESSPIATTDNGDGTETVTYLGEPIATLTVSFVGVAASYLGSVVEVSTKQQALTILETEAHRILKIKNQQSNFNWQGWGTTPGTHRIVNASEDRYYPLNKNVDTAVTGVLREEGSVEEVEKPQDLRGYSFVTSTAPVSFLSKTQQTLSAEFPHPSTLTREHRAASIEVLEKHGDKFIVRNPSNGNHYVVDPFNPNPKERCQCGDTHFRGVTCKHQIAVLNEFCTKKVARQLEVGDGVVQDGKIWEVVGLRSQVAEVVRRGFYNILFTLRLKDLEGNSKTLTPYSEAEFWVIKF